MTLEQKPREIVKTLATHSMSIALPLKHVNFELFSTRHKPRAASKYMKIKINDIRPRRKPL